jgi:hypothetical protein
LELETWKSAPVKKFAGQLAIISEVSRVTTKDQLPIEVELNFPIELCNMREIVAMHRETAETHVARGSTGHSFERLSVFANLQNLTRRSAWCSHMITNLDLYY